MQIVGICLFLSMTSAAILTPYSRRLVDANNDFAATLLQQTRNSAPSECDNTGNVVLSPLSVLTGLGMLSLGARSQTALEIRTAMNLKTLSVPKVARGLDNLRRITNTADKLATADRIWAKEGTRLDKFFVERVGEHFDAAVEKLDFDREPAARRRINEWASNATGGEISELVPRGLLSAWTRLIVTDAIYFKGTWKTRFRVDETKSMTFRGCNVAAQVDMMHQDGYFPYRRSDDDRVRVVELPYRGDNVSMIVVLPDDCEALTRLEKDLTAAKIERLIGGLTPREVNVHFPRFELGYRASLAKVLRHMGIESAFSPGVADFSGIDGTRDLYVSDTVHEAVVGVNEDGTTAAAASTTLLHARMMPVHEEFRADRPFLFFIVDKRSSAILFAGRVVDPRSFGRKASAARCAIATPGPALTPTTPLPCPKCPVHRSNDISLEAFCRRKYDFVLIGRLQNVTKLPSRLRYHLQVDRVVKPGGTPVRAGDGQDYIWPKRYFKRCNCKLERGKRYVIAGHDNGKSKKKVLKMDSFVVERKSAEDVNRIRSFLAQCQKGGRREDVKKRDYQ